MSAFVINGDTVTLIWADEKSAPLDVFQWELYKVNVLGIWPGEPDEDAEEQPETDGAR